jgi:hypothetical protein
MWEVVDAVIDALLSAVPAKSSEVLWDRGTQYGPLVAVEKDLASFLATVATTKNVFEALTPADRVQALLDRFDQVKKHRDAALTELTDAGRQPSRAGVFDRMRTNFRCIGAQLPTGADPKPTDALKDVVTDFAWLLRHDETSTRGSLGEELRTKDARALLALRDDEVKKKMTADFSTSATAANLLLQLRCLDAVYARFRVAVAVQKLTDMPLSKILALWRVEGDLAIPPTAESLEGLDVAEVANTRIPLPPGRLRARTRYDPRPHIFTTAAIVDQQKFRDYDGHPKDAELAGWVNWDYHWFIMGLDVLSWSPPDEAAAWRKATATRSEIINGTWWLTEALAGGIGGQMQVRPAHLLELRSTVRGIAPTMFKDDIDHRARELHVIDKGSSWVVAPSASPSESSTSGIKYASAIVAEGVWLLKWIEQNSKVPFISSPSLMAGAPLPPILAYSLYHYGLHKAPAIWASAIAHAAASTSPIAKALTKAVETARVKANVDPVALRTLKADIRNATQKDAPTLALDHWEKVLLPIIKPNPQPAVVDALANFIVNADFYEWGSFPIIRGNLLRFHNLVLFYESVFR